MYDQKYLETGVHFPDGRVFAWALRLDPDVATMVSDFSDGLICVRLPLQEAERWIQSETVGMESHADGVHVLVEKDFPCKDRPDEDKKDFFEELADQQAPLC
ncbi:MAG: hypothetical protein RL742_1717 [Bacteroidota bacterium]